jgi:hypothetical protein
MKNFLPQGKDLCKFIRVSPRVTFREKALFMLDFLPEKSEGTGTSYQANGNNQRRKSIPTQDVYLHFSDSFFIRLFSSFVVGAAKKRDVRTINSSPCDLGPPSKTSTNGAATGTPRSAARPIAALRKSHQSFSLTSS